MKLGGGCQQHPCLFSQISSALARASFNEMSISIGRKLQQPSPGLCLQPVPAETLMEQHSSPSWSSWPQIITIYLSDLFMVFPQADVLTSPTPWIWPLLLMHCAIFLFLPPRGGSIAAMFVKKDRSSPSSCLAFVSVRGKYSYSLWARPISCQAEGARGCTEHGSRKVSGNI